MKKTRIIEKFAVKHTVANEVTIIKLFDADQKEEAETFARKIAPNYDMTNGEIMVRECVSRKILTRPLTMKWLEISQTYWYHRGVKDWGLVVDEAAEE